MSRESLHPREDVVELRARVTALEESLRSYGDDLRRTETELADGTAHARQLLTADLAHLQDAQAADKAAARERDDDLRRRIDAMVRRIDETLTGLGDQQELLAGLRALVRMARTEPA